MKTILNMYQHLEWANQRIMAQLQSTNAENKSAVRLFSHILLAEQVWHARIIGEDATAFKVWDDFDLDDCAKLVQQNKERYTALLTNLSAAGLEKEISYQNTQGKEFVNTVGDILTHVALHGQHHRGQINQKLRESGLAPKSIDYISMVR